jgi:hypothetical protein
VERQLRSVAMMSHSFLLPAAFGLSPHRRKSLSTPNGATMWCVACASTVRR